MFAGFIAQLRASGVPASLTEYLTLLRAMKEGCADYSVESFYFLARAALVKDERLIDRFDRVFAHFFRGLGSVDPEIMAELPAEWLKKLAERLLTPEEMAAVEALGGWDKLMETLRQRLAEQKERHQGGSKWIGTAGTSPFGAYGYNPEGIRIGQGDSRNRSAVKVWDKREFRDLDGEVELGTRGMKLALRRLRRFAREGQPDELDISSTIRATAHNAGLLDLKMQAERRNKVKVLLLLDIGGSMDDHVAACEQLFSAARAEFKHLETFHFHNCPYERLWRTNRRRSLNETPTFEILRTYGADWRLVFVGDATMSPYEITQPGGSIEHWNEEAGQTWVERLTGHFERAVWINPRPEGRWEHVHSLQILRRLMEGRMYPLSLDGLDNAMRELALMTALRRVKLPDGQMVPALGQGTWKMGESRSKRKDEVAALKLGLDLGLTLIDTAEMYAEGGAEEVVAEAIKGRRREVFLVSKVYPHNASRAGVVTACERSLKRLKCERIDLYLLHWRGGIPLGETLAGFAELQAAGKIRYFGVSNFDTADMKELQALPGGRDAATNQVLYNLKHRGIEFDLLPFAEAQALPIMAYSPLEIGPLQRAGALRRVAERQGVSTAQIALAWVLRRPDVIAIPKASRLEHVRENRAALDLVLSAEDLADLNSAAPPPQRSTPLEMI